MLRTNLKQEQINNFSINNSLLLSKNKIEKILIECKDRRKMEFV